MAESQLLEKLRDIHLPPSISWQLAPGWYIVIGFCLFLIVILSRKRIKHYFGLYSLKQIALNLLSQYKKEYQEQGDAHALSIKVSELLRRVALAYFPRQQVAGLKGKAWIDFLNHTGKHVDFHSFEDILLRLPYQNKESAPLIDLGLLLQSAEMWIRQRGKA